MTPVELAQRFEEVMKDVDAPILYYNLSLGPSGNYHVEVMTDKGGLERLAVRHSQRISGVLVHNGFPYMGSTTAVNSLDTLQVADGFELRAYSSKLR